MEIVDLVNALRTRYQREEVAIDEARLYVESAIREYSRWNPRVASTSFSSVQDQQAYDLPAACIGVIDVLWLPMGDVLISGAERLAIHQKDILETFNQYALRHVDRINEAEYHGAIRGDWEVRNNQVLLWPIPTSAAHTITVQYATLHILNAAKTGYDTVPDEDFDIIVSLTLAELLVARRLELSLEPDWAEGLTRISYRTATASLQGVVDDLREPVVKKYSRPVGSLA